MFSQWHYFNCFSNCWILGTLFLVLSPIQCDNLKTPPRTAPGRRSPVSRCMERGVSVQDTVHVYSQLAPALTRLHEASGVMRCRACYHNKGLCSPARRRKCVKLGNFADSLNDAALRYLCERQVSRTIKRLLPCLRSNAVRAGLAQCTESMPKQTAKSGLCQLPSNFTSCVLPMAEQSCSGTANLSLHLSPLLTGLFEMFTRTFCRKIPSTSTSPPATTQPLTTVAQKAETTIPPTTDYPTTPASNRKTITNKRTTTEAPPPRTTLRKSAITTTTSSSPADNQCYSCHSGGSRDWQTAQCPADGRLSGWARSSLVACAAPCVSVVNRWPLGDVTRGCSSDYYFGGARAPRTGCLTSDLGTVFCFCQGHVCNDGNYTEQVAELQAMFG